MSAIANHKHRTFQKKGFNGFWGFNDFLFLCVFFVGAVSLLVATYFAANFLEEKEKEHFAEKACQKIHADAPRKYEKCFARVLAVSVAGKRGESIHGVCLMAYPTSEDEYAWCIQRVSKAEIFNEEGVFINNREYTGQTKKEFCMDMNSNSTADYLDCIKTNKVKYCETIHPQLGDDFIDCIVRQEQ